MKWQGIVLTIVTLLVMLAGILLFVIPAKAPTTPAGQATSTAKASLDDLIVVDTPLPGASVTSPIAITGKARGTWYFEASFPIVLTDWDGKIIAQGHGQAEGDWMTSDYVPFTATLTYTTPTPGDLAVNRGSLILKNDNPSGDPSRERALEIPVIFK